MRVSHFVEVQKTLVDLLLQLQGSLHGLKTCIDTKKQKKKRTHEIMDVRILNCIIPRKGNTKGDPIIEVLPCE